jgi:hypothetical protein
LRAREAFIEETGKLCPSVAWGVLAAQEVVRREPGRPVTLVAVVGEQPHDDGFEIGRDALPVLAGAPDGREADRRSDIAAQQSGAEPLMREELPEHDPDRVQIGPAIELLPASLLG